MGSKQRVLLLIAITSLTIKPLLAEIQSDYFYYAFGAIKNMCMILLCGLGVIYLKEHNKGSLLLIMFLFINLVVCPTNILLVDKETFIHGVAANEYYLEIQKIRWAGKANLSLLYSSIEWLMVLQGVWGIGNFIINSIMARFRVLRDHIFGSNTNLSTLSKHTQHI